MGAPAEGNRRQMKLSIFLGACGLSAGLIAGCGSTSDTPADIGGTGGDIGTGSGGSGTLGTGGTLGGSGASGTGAGTATGGAATGNGGAAQGNGGTPVRPDGGLPGNTCTSDANCMGRRAAGPVCDLATSQCVECLVPGDCNNGETCNTASHRCATSCGAGADGGGACGRGTPVCDTAKGFCVQCMSGSDCTTSSTRHQCFTNTGRCVECLTNADCGDGGGTCDPTDHSCQ
jgi:hypothetical protein